MKLRNLKAFCHVAETGSLSAAARLNGITPASASSRLVTLEQQLGLMLLERKRQQHKLTPAGQVLYEHAREILRLYEDAKARLHNGAQTKSENGKLKS
jgi:molybdate transport repressor ModE-like protein